MWPETHPAPRTLGDAEMLISGAVRPMTGFGGLLPMPSEAMEAMGDEGGVVLVDDEGAPVAAVSKDGSVEARSHPASGSYRHLARGPSAIAEHGPCSGVLVRRPLLAAEVSALAEIGEDSSVLLLVRSVDPEVPVDTLIRATQAAAAQIPSSLVATVPFARRDDAEDDHDLGRIILRNHAATPVDVLKDDHEWDRVATALDSDDETTLREMVDPASLAVLRQWRPRRSERGMVVFFTGLSGSGKSTVARGLVDRLHETDRTLTVLDGDVARRMLSSGLTFSREDRDLNIRRLGWVGAEVARHGGVGVLAPIAPFAGTRAEVRTMVEAQGDLVLVWISTPLEECERRDRKGLYAKARRGEIPDFTGISSPYEPPEDADLVIDTTGISVDDAVGQVWGYLVDGGWISERAADGAS